MYRKKKHKIYKLKEYQHTKHPTVRAKNTEIIREFILVDKDPNSNRRIIQYEHHYLLSARVHPTNDPT